MAIHRIALGAAEGTFIFGDTLMISDVVLSEGSTLVVAVGAVGTIAVEFNEFSVSWGPTRLRAADGSGTTGYGSPSYMFYAEDVPAGTHDIVFTCINDAQAPASRAMFAVELREVDADGFEDYSAHSSRPDTTSTATATHAHTVPAGKASFSVTAVLTEGPISDDQGTWAPGTTSGQRAGNADLTLAEGYGRQDASGAYTFGKHGFTARVADLWVVDVLGNGVSSARAARASNRKRLPHHRRLQKPSPFLDVLTSSLAPRMQRRGPEYY